MRATTTDGTVEEALAFNEVALLRGSGQSAKSGDFTMPVGSQAVQVRARAWARALQAVPGVEAETLTPAPLDTDGHLGHVESILQRAKELAINAVNPSGTEPNMR